MKTPSNRALAIVGLIVAAGVVTWWVLHQTGGPSRTAPDGAATNTPAEQAGTARAPAQTGQAGGAARPGAPGQTVAPVVYSAVVSAEVAALINRMSAFGASGAQAELARRGVAVLPELLAALRSIADQQDALPATATEELTRLERQKLQLIPVIGQIGTLDAAPVLIEVARRSRPNSYAFVQTSDALDMIGATTQANQFAAELAARPDASKAMLMAVFTRFAYQEAPAAVIDAASRWTGASADPRIRNAALHVLASSGRDAQVTAAYRAMAQNPDSVDFTVLSAIAESARPTDFNRLIEGVPLQPYYRRVALEENAFHWAPASQKTNEAANLLRYRDLQEAQAAGLKHLLENNDTATLTRLGVAGVAGDPPAMWVRPDYKVIMARLGYRLDPAGTGIVIVRQTP